MATIVIEWEFDCPGSAGGVRRLMEATEDATASNAVIALRHYLSADGRRLIAMFDAPGAEAVRRATGVIDAGRPRRIWAATPHFSQGSGVTPPRGRRSLVVVERSFGVPTPFERVLPSKEIMRLCFELRGVTHVASYVAEDQMRILCVDEAPDAESVRVANRHAGMQFDAVWHASDAMEYGPCTLAAVG